MLFEINKHDSVKPSVATPEPVIFKEDIDGKLINTDLTWKLGKLAALLFSLQNL